jgi:membrane-bound ClpP family serine protease
MEKKSFVDCERNRLQRLLNFRLPTAFKRLGVILLVIAFVLFFFRIQFPDQGELLRGIGRKVFIVGLLFMSLARDKEEDEMTIALRAQSYAVAFIVGVVYAIIMPYVEFGVSNVVHDGGEAYKDLGDFQVLSFMLMIQLGIYHTLKRYR